jgi:hypothetical protein
MEIMLDTPLLAASLLGEANSPFRGKEATSEKKKEVLMVGVLGVLGSPPRGVFKTDPKPPPGEKSPLEDGD